MSDEERCLSEWAPGGPGLGKRTTHTHTHEKRYRCLPSLSLISLSLSHFWSRRFRLCTNSFAVKVEGSSTAAQFHFVSCSVGHRLPAMPPSPAFRKKLKIVNHSCKLTHEGFIAKSTSPDFLGLSRSMALSGHRPVGSDIHVWFAFAELTLCLSKKPNLWIVDQQKA